MDSLRREGVMDSLSLSISGKEGKNGRGKGLWIHYRSEEGKEKMEEGRRHCSVCCRIENE